MKLAAFSFTHKFVFYLIVHLVSVERLRDQRPTLVVPPDVSTSVKEIWIGNLNKSKNEIFINDWVKQKVVIPPYEKYQRKNVPDN